MPLITIKQYIECRMLKEIDLPELSLVRQRSIVFFKKGRVNKIVADFIEFIKDSKKGSG